MEPLSFFSNWITVLSGSVISLCLIISTLSALCFCSIPEWKGKICQEMDITRIVSHCILTCKQSFNSKSFISYIFNYLDVYIFFSFLHHFIALTWSCVLYVFFELLHFHIIIKKSHLKKSRVRVVKFLQNVRSASLYRQHVHNLHVA